MATYFDYYEIDIHSGETNFVIDPKWISFSVNDSIHSFYNTGSMIIEDPGGLLLERLVFTKGLPFELSYGIKSHSVNTGKYVITNSYLENSPETPGVLSGEVTIKFKNQWYSQQEIQSKGYNTLISSIISNITTPISELSGNDIETTEGADYWYQPLINDATFINKILTPHAYSPSANNTPFYAYITNDNIFRFKSAYRMYNSGIADELNYPVNITMENNTPQTIMDARLIKEDRNVERHLRNREVFHINSTTGALERKTNLITSHLSRENKLLPFIANMDLVTGYIDQGKEEITIDARNNELGYLHHTHKPGMFLEKLILLTSLNPSLKSGQKVYVTLSSSSNKDKSEKSKTFSGEYVIENCEHIWNGDEARGYTKLIVGRKYIRTGATYLIRDRLAR